MKISFDIDNSVIVSALSNPHSRSWCSGIDFDPETLEGTILEIGDGDEEDIEHDFDEQDIAVAIYAMLTSEDRSPPEVAGRILSGVNDGPDRDMFVQFIAFGEWKYS